jgi:hypothetical protein
MCIKRITILIIWNFFFFHFPPFSGKWYRNKNQPETSNRRNEKKNPKSAEKAIGKKEKEIFRGNNNLVNDSFPFS